MRLRAGHRLHSPALVADGKHARADGFVSLGVIVSAAAVAAGLERAYPVVGLVITGMRDGGRYSYAAYGEGVGTVEVSAESASRRSRRSKDRLAL